MSELDDLLDGDTNGLQVSHLQRLITALRLREQKARELYDAMERGVCRALEGVPTPKTPPRPAPSRKKKAEHAVLLCSDWQVGSKTEDFNTQVAIDRVHERLLPAVYKIVKGRRTNAKLDTLHLMFMGDMVDGSSMRLNQAWDVDSTVIDQALFSCPSLMSEVVLSMMQLFPVVDVHACRGNHGREGAKKGNVHPKKVNWDSAANRACELMLGNLVDGKRLSFNVVLDSWYTIVPVGKTNVLVVHGDQIAGGANGIIRKMVGWHDALPPWDVMVLGHFHVPASGMQGPRQFFLNGTLQTSSDYVKEDLAANGRASQRLLIFDEDKGVISDHIIWLSD